MGVQSVLKKDLFVNVFPLSLMILSFYNINSVMIPPTFCFPARFTAVAQTDLKEPLKVLGVTEMFDPSKANFAKITSMFSLKLPLNLVDCVTNRVPDLFRTLQS